MAAKRTLPDCVCETCGKSFRKKSNTTGQFCSKKCWYAAYDKSNVRTCVVCGETFEGQSKQKTCSTVCASQLKRTAKRNTHCAFCNEPLRPDVHPRVRFCSRSCSQAFNKNGGREREDGSRQPHGSGYTMIKVDGVWVLEHRHVMEQILHRPLESFERVHHKDGDRANNDPPNLELWMVKKKDPAGQRVDDLIEAVLKRPEVEGLTVEQKEAVRVAIERVFKL